MDPFDLMALAVSRLDELSVPYIVTGSIASTNYGEPRLTNDVDIVVRLTSRSAERIVEAFEGEDCYASVEAAREAARLHGQFNILHRPSGFKIDFMVSKEDEFDESRFARARIVEYDSGAKIRMASPEDVIIRKLQYYKEGGSDKHLRDVRGILKETEVDRAYIERWVREFGVETQWAEAQR